jgi:hypothetical protein
LRAGPQIFSDEKDSVTVQELQFPEGQSGGQRENDDNKRYRSLTRRKEFSLPIHSGGPILSYARSRQAFSLSAQAHKDLGDLYHKSEI